MVVDAGEIGTALSISISPGTRTTHADIARPGCWLGACDCIVSTRSGRAGPVRRDWLLEADLFRQRKHEHQCMGAALRKKPKGLSNDHSRTNYCDNHNGV